MSEILSALTDGQATPEDAARATAAWRDDPQARATWHRYQLIGDALRSPDLLQASDGEAFLKGFRARLSQEAVVLAPRGAAVAASAAGTNHAAATAAPSLKRRPWAGPAAVAASFALMVGLLASNLSVGSGSGAPQPAGRVDTMASVHNPAWASLDPRQGGNAFAASASALTAAPLLGASFDSTDQTEGVLIKDPRVEPELSLQRPMVIDAPAFRFSEANLVQPISDTGR
jgi:negative regulator of sigma E activity